MDDLDFKRYSGPYSRVIEYICRIADYFEEEHYSSILEKYGLDIVEIEPKDENGERELYADSLYFFIERGKIRQPSPNQKFYSLSAVGKVCQALEDGRIKWPPDELEEPTESTDPTEP